MTDPAPSLPEQIEAIEWARARIAGAVREPEFRRLDELANEILDKLRGLDAAAETMKTWEFARETLK